MKLRIKIFISILIVTLTTLSISSYYLINKSHLDNIMREQDRSVNEFDFVLTSLDNSIDFSIESSQTLKELLSRFAGYYALRGIDLLIYRKGVPYYIGKASVSIPVNSMLLNTGRYKKYAQIISKNGCHYILVSANPSFAPNYTIVYSRDISEIYHSRTNSIYMTVAMALILFILLSFLSFFYSRWITRPIERLQEGAAAISQGEYGHRIPPTNDEFNSLAHAFNHMADAVRSRSEELEKRANDLQEFIDDLSHEMNTPLTSIQGYSEFLQNTNASPEHRQMALAAIKQETKRLRDIYEKLMQLTISRVHEASLQPTNISVLFNELADSFRPQLEKQNAHLHINNELDMILMDSSFIYILLSNFIRNSLKALPENGGSIGLSAYMTDKRPVIEVTDNGYGIPKDKIEAIVKPFYRVDKSRSRKTGGVGLGLSICKNIAKLHKADFIIESEEGKGTYAKLIFPSL